MDRLWSMILARLDPAWMTTLVRCGRCGKEIWRRGESGPPFHRSDQVSQNSSERFQKLLADHGVTFSMSGSGKVWDNAAMESFFFFAKLSEGPQGERQV